MPTNEYKVISWEEKDDVQKTLSSLEIDAVSALNTALQYKYVLELFDNNLDFINRAPCFWGEVISSLRYSMLMQTARLFDESRDAIGMRKALSRLEQSKHGNAAKEALEIIRDEYKNYERLISDVRRLRDKFYAHNDRITYVDWNNERECVIEDPLWSRIIELLTWARNSFLALRSTYGDNFPLQYETKNDVGNILPTD